jgi:hypothetical protein
MERLRVLAASAASISAVNLGFIASRQEPNKLNGLASSLEQCSFDVVTKVKASLLLESN